MKKVLLIMAAILLANAVSAQNYEKNILGVRAGLNLSSYSISAGGIIAQTNCTLFTNETYKKTDFFRSIKKSV